MAEPAPIIASAPTKVLYAPPAYRSEKVRRILNHFFSEEITLPILDLAEFWGHTSVGRHLFMSVSYMNEPQEPYVSVAITHRNRLRRIVFRTRSCDQGVSYDYDYHMSYNSGTWFEAGIAGRPEAGRLEIQYNLHACAEWMDHLNEWDVVGEGLVDRPSWSKGNARRRKEDMARWFAELREGDVVEVWPKARFGRWRNKVAFVEVDVMWAL